MLLQTEPHYNTVGRPPKPNLAENQLRTSAEIMFEGLKSRSSQLEIDS